VDSPQSPDTAPVFDPTIKPQKVAMQDGYGHTVRQWQPLAEAECGYELIQISGAMHCHLDGRRGLEKARHDLLNRSEVTLRSMGADHPLTHAIECEKERVSTEFPPALIATEAARIARLRAVFRTLRGCVEFARRLIPAKNAKFTAAQTAWHTIARECMGLVPGNCGTRRGDPSVLAFGSGMLGSADGVHLGGGASRGSHAKFYQFLLEHYNVVIFVVPEEYTSQVRCAPGTPRVRVFSQRVCACAHARGSLSVRRSCWHAIRRFHAGVPGV